MNDSTKVYPPDFPFRAVVEQAIAGIYVLQDECFVYVNATFSSMIGYTPEEMTGMSLRQIVPPDFVDRVLDLYYQRLQGNLSSAHFVSRGKHKEGRVVMVEVHGSRMEYRGRPAIVGVAIDVTERIQREEELRQSRAQLQELAAYINRIREDQRAKFAREVHDVLGGMLTSMKMDATRILRRAQTDELADITRGLLDLTQNAIDAVREISEELRPSVLDHLGLNAAIERELSVFSDRYSTECRFESNGSAVPISSKRATAVYRIFQEALTNIARHSGATKVKVDLDCQNDELHMEVVDNGRGFDLTPDLRGSLGVLSMRERARELGGTLDIGRNADRGTRLRLVVPLEAEVGYQND